MPDVTTNRDELIRYFSDDRRSALHRWAIEGDPRDREFALLSSLRVTRVIEATSLGLDTPFDENKGIRLDLISL